MPETAGEALGTDFKRHTSSQSSGEFDGWPRRFVVMHGGVPRPCDTTSSPLRSPAERFAVVGMLPASPTLWGLLQIISWERMAPPQDIVEIGVRGGTKEYRIG
jgi:hypothetical protein